MAVIFPKENGKFIFPVADGRIKFVGGDQELRTSTLIRDHPIRGEDQTDFLGQSEGSPLPLPQDSLLDFGEARNVFGPFQETSFAAITLSPESNFIRREKNHSQFHWNTLTSPELHIQTWMLCEKAASMIIGISMDQESCLILGKVSPKETDKTASVIHARSFMARTLENVKERWADGEAYMGNWKQKLDNARRLRGIYFIWPWGHGVQGNHQKRKEKIGNTNGSSYALQDLQEKQAWRNP